MKVFLIGLGDRISERVELLYYYYYYIYIYILFCCFRAVWETGNKTKELNLEKQKKK